MNKTYARLLILFAVIAFAIPSFAQTFRGAINGTVTDSTGAVVPSAQITAVDTATNVSYSAVSTSSGEFSFSNLPIGTYTITVTVPGFSTEKYDKVSVEAGTPYTLSAKLAVSTTNTTVEVDAGAIGIDTVTDIQASTLPETVVQNLPNSGRDFTQFIGQTTGFAGDSSGGGAGTSSVNGTRTNAVNWQIEGTDNNDLWWNIPAVNQGGVSAIAGVIFPIDAIESFNFVTTGSTSPWTQPRRHRKPRHQIRNGNSLHGSAYYFNHNEFFDKQKPILSTSSPHQGESRLVDYGFSRHRRAYHPRTSSSSFVAGEHQNFLIGALNPPPQNRQPPTRPRHTSVLDYYGVPHSPVAANLLNGNGTLAGLWPTDPL